MGNDILKFCLKARLLEQDKVQFLYSYYERRPLGICSVINEGVDEKALFQAAAKEYNCPLMPSKAIVDIGDYSHILSEKEQEYFHCRIIGIGEDDAILVVSWNFFNINIIPHALKQLTGKKVELSLMTCSEFKKLRAVKKPGNDLNGD